MVIPEILDLKITKISLFLDQFKFLITDIIIIVNYTIIIMNSLFQQTQSHPILIN